MKNYNKIILELQIKYKEKISILNNITSLINKIESSKKSLKMISNMINFKKNKELKATIQVSIKGINNLKKSFVLLNKNIQNLEKQKDELENTLFLIENM